MFRNNIETLICAIDIETREILYLSERCPKRINDFTEKTSSEFLQKNQKMYCYFCPIERYKEAFF